MRPGFVHARKHGTRFWGRKFDATAPQSLVFWCPSTGHCTLTTYMYRAPAGKPPGTWGDMLMWHRHGTTATASWMTHVWLLRGVRDGFATCAHWTALERGLGIHRERYRPHDHRPALQGRGRDARRRRRADARYVRHGAQRGREGRWRTTAPAVRPGR